jgi:hypothetical protein
VGKLSNTDISQFPILRPTMIFSTEASITGLSIHYTGNKLLNEDLILSEQPADTSDETLQQLLFKFFTGSFEKVNEVYRLWHPSGDLHLNEIFHFASAIFNDKDLFHEQSQKIASHLFDISSHPKIKSGELYIVHFDKLQVEGELLEAIGIFKSETKESYLKTSVKKSKVNIDYEEEAINIKKLDKGCLIFNTDEKEGYKVAVIDNTNRQSEAVYWIDDFLKLRVRNDEYTQTNNVMGIYKQFVTKQVDEVFEVSKADKIDLLNRSINYFKANTEFDLDTFSNEVIAHPDGIREFKRFKQQQEEELETPIADRFEINGAAFKKQLRTYKSVLKLDRNFHIYIHGNREMIEKGYDESKGMSYYKVYFNEEQ